MKEYEKLSIEESERGIADSYEYSIAEVRMASFVIGFLKAREMARTLCRNMADHNYDLLEEIEKLGEEEV